MIAIRSRYRLPPSQAADAATAINSAIANRVRPLSIVEYEQNGADRVAYGGRLLSRMSDRLRETGVRGASTTRLKLYRQRGSIGPTLSDQSLLPALPRGTGRTRPTPSDQFRRAWSTSLPQTIARLQGEFPLGWSHYVTLLSVTDPEARRFYEIEAAENGWSVRELKRQLDSSLYERLALSRDEHEVRRLALSRDEHEVRRLAREGQVVETASDLIKDPVVLELLGLEERPAYSESDLEGAIIDRLQHFLLELGKGLPLRGAPETLQLR